MPYLVGGKGGGLQTKGGGRGGENPWPPPLLGKINAQQVKELYEERKKKRFLLTEREGGL